MPPRFTVIGNHIARVDADGKNQVRVSIMDKTDKQTIPAATDVFESFMSDRARIKYMKEVGK